MAKFDGLKPRRGEDIKGIAAPVIGLKIFGTFERQALAGQQTHAELIGFEAWAPVAVAPVGHGKKVVFPFKTQINFCMGERRH